MFIQTDRPTFKKDLSALELLGIKEILRRLFRGKGLKNYRYSTYNSTGYAVLTLHTLGSSSQLTIEYSHSFDYDTHEYKKDYATIDSIAVSDNDSLYFISHNDYETLYLRLDNLSKLTTD